LGAIEPVSRRRRISLRTNDVLTPKRSAISARVSTPSSTAAATRSLRSIEYASMLHLDRKA
jgi:hypothetical protein